MLYVCNFVNWEIHCISCVFILVEFTKCLLWPDKKVLEGILFINAFLAPMIKLLHEYIPGTKKWESELGYFVLTFKALFFSHKKEISSTNSLHNKLLPYPSPIWTPQGFPLWEDRRDFLFSQNLTKSPHHSPSNFLILAINVLLLTPIFPWNGSLKSKVSGEAPWITT